MTWPDRPVVYEVNTAVWLGEVSLRAGRPVTLGDVEPKEWDAVCPAGVDALWLMGVWERSPAGIAVARADEALMASFRDSLPDVTDADLIGSPYCVRRYVVDARFGGPAAMPRVRGVDPWLCIAAFRRVCLCSMRSTPESVVWTQSTVPSWGASPPNWEVTIVICESHHADSQKGTLS